MWGGNNFQFWDLDNKKLFFELFGTQSFWKKRSQQLEVPRKNRKKTMKCHRGPIFTNILFLVRKIETESSNLAKRNDRFLAFWTQLKHQKPQTVCFFFFFSWVYNFSVQKKETSVLSSRAGCWSTEFRLTELNQTQTDWKGRVSSLPECRLVVGKPRSRFLQTCKVQ